MALSKWAFMGSLLTTEEDLAGHPEYEAWKQETGKSEPGTFVAEKIAEHAAESYAQGIAYSVYRPGDEQTPFVHVGDFVDEKSALKALVTEKGEAYVWNQEGKTLATRYESIYDAENTAENGAGTIRLMERGIPDFRLPFVNQAGLQAALVEAEQIVAQAGSVITARGFLSSETGGQVQLYRPNKDQSSRTGPIVWTDPNIAVQDIGGNNYIIHSTKELKQAMAAASLKSKDVMESVNISYNNGRMSIKEDEKAKLAPENSDQDYDVESDR